VSLRVTAPGGALTSKTSVQPPSKTTRGGERTFPPPSLPATAAVRRDPSRRARHVTRRGIRACAFFFIYAFTDARVCISDGWCKCRFYQHLHGEIRHLSEAIVKLVRSRVLHTADLSLHERAIFPPRYANPYDLHARLAFGTVRTRTHC